MSSIVKMYDASNNDVYPITHLRAVRDSNGTTLESMIQGVNETTVGYYECNTAGSTPEKTITIDSSVSLSVRISCKVKFAEKNTGANATMNINNTGAKPLFYNGVRASANNSWYTNEIVDLYFDGTNYQAKSCADTLEYDVSLHQNHEITEVTTTTRTVVYNGDVTSGWENETSVSDSSVNGYTRTETNTGKDNDTTTVDGPTAKYDTASNKTSVVYVTKRTLTHVVNDYTFDEAVNAVPMSYRHGGLKLRFISNSNGSVQNSDNKYVQYRLMKNTWSTTVSDWQGVDDEPVVGSENLVKSGGVAYSINQLKNAGYLYAGIATPTTNPGTLDVSVFYIANGKGTYTNFGGINVTEDEVVVLYYDTVWHKDATGIASNDKLTELDKQVRRVRIFGSSFEGSNVWIDSPMSLKKGFSYLIEGTAKYERSGNLFLFLSKEKNRQDENIIVSNLIIIPANNTTGITTWIADNDYDTAYIYLYQDGGNEVTLRITELSQQEILAQKLKCGQNVSLIYSSLGKVNIDLSRNVIDFGTDSVLFIAGQYYLVKQTVPLLDTSTSSAVKLVYDTETNIPRCIAYNTVLNENEVLIGSYRRYGDSIVNYSFPFEITINGKERWDEQVEAISEIVDKHTEAINSISSDLFQDISITNFVLDSQAFVNEPISLKAGVKYAFTTVLSEKRTGNLFIRLYSEKSTSSVQIVEFVAVRANKYHEVVEYTPQHDITNAYLWFYQSGGNTINLTISLPKKDVGNYNGCIKSINHQGANRLAPANTLPAFKKSKQLGFYAVETDVRFTKDNVPCLLHDATIDATSNGSGSLSSMTFEEVRQYDFSAKFSGGGYKNVKIPSLEEFLDVCKRIAIHPYIEIKEGGDDKLSIIANIVKSKGLDKFVTFICSNDAYLSYISNILPSARLGLILNFGQISQENINKAKALSNGTNEVFIDAEYYSGGIFIPQDDVDICIANGIPLEVWTLNEIAYIENMPMYISGVTSDSLIAGKVLYDYEIVT